MPRGRYHEFAGGDVSQDFSGRIALTEIHDKYFAGHTISTGLEQELRAIRRPARIVAERRDLALHARAARGGYDEQTAVSVFGAVGNKFAVGGPVRLPVLTGTLGNFDGSTTA